MTIGLRSRTPAEWRRGVSWDCQCAAQAQRDDRRGDRVAGKPSNPCRIARDRRASASVYPDPPTDNPRRIASERLRG
ncbi:MAG TPA: hypothetical protein VHX66_06605, partial [Solirubrobacteraceae bacterium]|nr:hypothetical protein [Solirubrobacteraceae bacterium]